jgi:hypothetical protein
VGSKQTPKLDLLGCGFGHFSGVGDVKNTNKMFFLFTKRQCRKKTYISDFSCSSTFWVGHVLGASQRGKCKHAIKKYVRKTHVENFLPKKTAKDPCRFFRFVLSFNRIIGRFSAKGAQRSHCKRILFLLNAATSLCYFGIAKQNTRAPRATARGAKEKKKKWRISGR